MFLCKECLRKRRENKSLELFEIKMFISYGQCEDCQEKRPCIDIHHSLLKKVS